MLTISVILLLGAFGTAIAGAMGKCPWWVPLILVILLVGLQVLPIK